MADLSKFVQAQPFSLAGGGISLSDTSITIKSFSVDGVDLTMDDFGDYATGTLEAGTEREEIISFTGVTQNADDTATLTGVTRGLQKKAPYTQDLDLRKQHGGNTQFVLTNNPQLYDRFANKFNDEVITGQWEGPDPTTSQGFVTRDYMLSLINGGAVSTNKITVSGTAGESVVAGDLLYLKSSDGKWWKADADVLSTIDNTQLGVSQGSGSADATITNGVLISGVDTNNNGTSGGYAYVSNTAGAVGTSAGTYTYIIGQFIPSSGGLYFNPTIYQVPTAQESQALVGSQGIPGSGNKYITEDNTSSATTDQTQTTQNGTVEVGEANTTTKKNLLAQSFISTKTKIRGVKLYKLADTGTFTGTVTIAIQADTSGSPSGTDLATKTFTNTEWLSLSTGEIEALFSAEYSMTVGSLYWIVVSTSTSDTSNHPNLGTNTAGGYANGSSKYRNTTDGWVSIATIDLYFKTLEGVNDQVVKTDTTGKIPSAFYDILKMPVPMFRQEFAITQGVSSNAQIIVQASTSTTDGSVIWIAGYNTIVNKTIFMRLSRDTNTGQYIQTHYVTSATNYNGNTVAMGLTLVGSYLYLFYDGGVNMSGVRILAADCTGETSLSLPVITTSGSPIPILAWTDGVFAYVLVSGEATVTKMSISGTTLSTSSTGSASTTLYNTYTFNSMFTDGSNIYSVQNSGTTIQVLKLADLFGATITSTTSYIINNYKDSGSATLVMSFPNTNNRMYLGRNFYISESSTSTGVQIREELIPVTKP